MNESGYILAIPKPLLRRGWGGGQELDEATGLYYYGARYYSPDLGMFISVDPMADRAPWISPYAYCFNNPLKYTDPDGRWPLPGVGFRFFSGRAGVGVNYALSTSQQSGVAYDKHGTTHFVMSRINHVTNQNLKEGSRNPNVYVGVEASFSAGVQYDWSSSSFVESISGTSMSLSISGKGIVGGEIGIGENSASLSVGLGIGGGINIGSMSVDFSVSLSKAEAKKVGKMSDVSFESWGVMDKSPIYTDGKISGFSGTVYTKDKNGKTINTGISVQSGYTLTNDGKNAKSNNVWVSKEYQSAIE